VFDSNYFFGFSVSKVKAQMLQRLSSITSDDGTR